MDAASATVVASAVTGGFAWVAQAWARRGRTEHPPATEQVTAQALSIVTDLRGRVERLEEIDDWRATVAVIKDDHIDVLEAHIWRRDPPPPPTRPTLPPRPR